MYRTRRLNSVVASVLVLALAAACAPATLRPASGDGQRGPQLQPTAPAGASSNSAAPIPTLPRPVVPTPRLPGQRAAPQPGQRRPAAPAPSGQANCSQTSVGLTPLSDLGTGTYHGYPGGLYPISSNQPPADYLQQGLAHAAKIQPLNANGKPDPNGKIVLLSVGMSNAFFEFQQFVQDARADPQRNPQVAVVNGAIQNRTADELIDPNFQYWSELQQRVAQAGATNSQVEVIWLKQAINYDVNLATPFPKDAQDLQADLEVIINHLEQLFPNLQIIYLSSRIYGGYASTPLNPEPMAYDSGFAVKWVIQDRITGVTNGPAWVAWGPYLWADGTHPRSDGLVWNCSDLRQTDGTHPSEPQGAEKVAQLLAKFFKSDQTATSWYVKK